MKEFLQALMTIMVIGVVMVGAFIWRVEYLAYVQDQKEAAANEASCRDELAHGDDTRVGHTPDGKAYFLSDLEAFVCGPRPLPRAD